MQPHNQNQSEEKGNRAESVDEEEGTGYGSVWNWSVPFLSQAAKTRPWGIATN